MKPSKSEGSGGGGGSAAAGLHAEQHFEYHLPLKAGDVLSATTKPGKSWEKEIGNNDFESYSVMYLKKDP